MKKKEVERAIKDAVETRDRVWCRMLCSTLSNRNISKVLNAINKLDYEITRRKEG